MLPVTKVPCVTTNHLERGNAIFIKYARQLNNANWTKEDNQNIWCYHDGHPFTTDPIPLIESYDAKRKIFYAGVQVFCSFECYKAYLIEFPIAYTNTHLHHLNTLVTHMHGQTNIIYAAHPRSILKVFGGSKTISEFRASHGNTKVLLHLLKKPMMYADLVFEQYNMSLQKSHDTLQESKPVPSAPSLFTSFVQQQQQNANMDICQEVEPKNTVKLDNDTYVVQSEKKLNSLNKAPLAGFLPKYKNVATTKHSQTTSKSTTST